MPIYEYKCTECQHRLEKLQKMSDDALKDCPECGKSTLTKLVSAASFKLKGTGWYETDFKGSKKTASDKGSPKSSKSASSKSETNTKPSKTASASD